MTVWCSLVSTFLLLTVFVNKTYINFVLIFYLGIMNVMDSYSQEFGGTWMRLDLAHDVMLFPRLNILKVENQKITSFEFNSIYEEFEGSMDEYFGIKPKSTGAGFEWYGPNILVVKCRASNYDT